MPGIEDYAMIGDLKTAALVSSNGSIDWLCLPHFDSPACFAALLGTRDHGFWSIRPADQNAIARQRYLPDTLVLETEWLLGDSRATVHDFMPVRADEDDEVTVVRIVRASSGTVVMRSDVAFRFDYGRVVPWVTHEGSRIRAIAGPDAAYLWSNVDVHGKGPQSVSEFELRSGDEAWFVLTWRASHMAHPEPAEPIASLEATIGFWREWAARARGIEGPYSDAILRSLITLKALTFRPTGGIVAAATTSLPERIGGPRNWDYRFCWLRDAAMSLRSLSAAGYRDEPEAWRQWLLRAIAGEPSELQIMYGLDGRRRLPEATLPWLPGYEGSRPVRLGNDAADQLQLDAWGEIMRGLSVWPEATEETEQEWELQCALLRRLEEVWRLPDNGLWEVRGPRRHFTYSKVMAWVAVDGMITEATELGLEAPFERWDRLRTEIKEDVLEHGFDASRMTFTQSYGSEGVDASLLQMGTLGFLEPDDPRMVGTVEAVERELLQDGFVLRYRPEESDDGMPGDEGVFLACSFWLVDALLGIGRRHDAEVLFQRLLEVRNHVGLLSEEWDPVTGRQLGNTPQAFSHFALINTALRLHNGDARIPSHPR